MSIYSTYSDKELISLLKVEGEDNYAFAEIYKRYFHLLVRHGLKKLEEADEVKDVIHELFLNLWIHRQTISITTSLSSYLYTAVKNRIINVLLEEKYVSKSIDSMYNHIIRSEFLIEQDIFMAEMKAGIKKEVERLPEKMRRIFMLSRFEELSHKEIAEKLSISENLVKKQIQNALKILKPRLLAALIAILIH